MEPRKTFLASSFWLVLIISLYGVKASSSEEHHVMPHEGPVVEKGERKTLIDTEYGEISSIDIKGGHRAPPYHLQFFTLEPNSLFLPVLLHANMVFYVHTGSGKLTWADEDGTNNIDLREGDLCKLNEGSIFYIHSNLESERKKLRIYAMFANTEDTTYDPSIGAYSRINELVKGFDKKIIQAAFKVREDLVEAIINKTEPPAIVHANSKEHKTFWELEASVLKNFLGIRSNSKKLKTYNIFKNDPDFKNCHGWSLTVTKKQFKSLKGTNTGFLYVNLTTGSILGPHWNPRATEIAMVVEGEGMVRVVCGTNNKDNKMGECTNMRFKVKQGDLFVVPKFHPMAQMSFNNDSLVFLGFSTAAKENHPQFLAGKRSVLGVLDRHILATSFGVSNRTIDQLLASQDDEIIFGCVSCAEEEERIMKEEREEEEEKGEARKRKEEEEKERRRKEEEEEREREEEEEARKQQEEREKRREEEEARRQREEQKEQEEARREEERRREEEARREQEQARKQQEERERKKEEEAKSEEERERREEEEEQEQEKEQEKARKQKEAQREEEQARREQEKRERRRQEEEAKREKERRREEEVKREQEEARKQQEERERKKEEEAEREQERERREEEEEQEHEKEQEKAREQKEAQREEEQARREQEERERRRQEEEAKREKERRQEEEGEKEQEQARREEEEEAQREQEQAQRQQEERERRREEEAERERQGGRRQHRRGDKGRGQEEEEAAEWEQEEAKRQQEERERRREEEGDEVEVKGNRSSFEGRRVLKIKNL